MQRLGYEQDLPDIPCSFFKSGLLVVMLFITIIGLLILYQNTYAEFSFTYPKALNTNADTDTLGDNTPHIATDKAGNWIVVWNSNDNLGNTIGTDSDILFSRSMNNGITWSAPSVVNTNAYNDQGIDSSPRITTDGSGNWLVVWQSNNSLSNTIGTDYDILVSHSEDNGITWSAPAVLNTNAFTDSGNDIIPQIETNCKGNWIVLWHSNDTLNNTIGTDYDILISRSYNNGTSWTAPAALNTNAFADSGLDYSPQAATDAQGNWLVVWQSSDSLSGTIGTDGDILVARSGDNATTWTAPAALNANAFADSGHDYSPQVVTDGNGNWLVVWRSKENLCSVSYYLPPICINTDDDILFSRSTDNGMTWSDPGALNTNAFSDSGADSFVQVATDSNGNWLAVWICDDSLGETIGTDKDILVSFSTGMGAVWTPPVAVNTNATEDSGSDYTPQIATDNHGNWLVVWYSNENLDGIIGSDTDILIARGITIPAVSSIECLDQNPTSVASVNFKVTYNLNVSGVDASDFTIETTGGISGARVSGVYHQLDMVTGIRCTFVEVGGYTGTGTIGLNVEDDDTIVDMSTGIPLGGWGIGNGDYMDGPVYEIICLPAMEICDGIDNDCDGQVDEEGAEGCITYYKDMDDDGLGISGDNLCLCATEGYYTAIKGTDPDDNTPGYKQMDILLVKPNLGNPLLLNPRQFLDEGFILTVAGRDQKLEFVQRVLQLTQNYTIYLLKDYRKICHLQVIPSDNTRDYPDHGRPSFPITSDDHKNKAGFLWEWDLRVRISGWLEDPPAQWPQMFDIGFESIGEGIRKINHHAVYVDERFMESLEDLDSFTILHATDTHVSRRNDRIPEILARVRYPHEDIYYEDLMRSYCNFNKNFRDFIECANKKMSRSQEPVFVVLTGDLVDYFQDNIPLPYDQRNNYQVLRDIITNRDAQGEALKCPLFTIPGNHDYLQVETPLHFLPKVSGEILDIDLIEKVLEDFKQEKYNDFGLTLEEGDEYTYWMSGCPTNFALPYPSILQLLNEYPEGLECDEDYYLNDTMVNLRKSLSSVWSDDCVDSLCELVKDGLSSTDKLQLLKEGCFDYTKEMSVCGAAYGLTDPAYDHIGEYLSEINYDTDFSIKIGAHQLLFLNTGEDILPERPDCWWMIVEYLLGGEEEIRDDYSPVELDFIEGGPHNRGITHEHFDMLEYAYNDEAADSGSSIIFCFTHAPLLCLHNVETEGMGCLFEDNHKNTAWGSHNNIISSFLWITLKGRSLPLPDDFWFEAHRRGYTLGGTDFFRGYPIIDYNGDADCRGWLSFSSADSPQENGVNDFFYRLSGQYGDHPPVVVLSGHTHKVHEFRTDVTETGYQMYHLDDYSGTRYQDSASLPQADDKAEWLRGHTPLFMTSGSTMDKNNPGFRVVKVDGNEITDMRMVPLLYDPNSEDFPEKIFYHLKAVPPYMDFGEVYYSRTKSIKIIIFNNVPDIVDILFYNIIGSGAGDYRVATDMPEMIPPYGTVTLFVEFTPGEKGDRYATFNIEAKSSNEGKYHSVHINLYGEGLSAIQVTPQEMDFGTFDEDRRTNIRFLSVCNHAQDMSITIQSIDIIGQYVADFYVMWAGGGYEPYSITLGENETFEIPVICEPEPSIYERNLNATLEIVSDDPWAQNIQVPLSGFQEGETPHAIDPDLLFDILVIERPVDFLHPELIIFLQDPLYLMDLIPPLDVEILETTAPMFVWDQIEGAAGYHLQVLNQINNNVIWDSQVAAGITSVIFNYNGTATGPLQPGNLYSWSVAGIYGGGYRSRTDISEEDDYLSATETPQIDYIHYIIIGSPEKNDPPIITGEPRICTIHDLCNGAESYAHLATVQVNDPDGPSDILSVTLTGPDDSIFMLHDASINPGDTQGKGMYKIYISGLNHPWSGDFYKFTITDKAGYIMNAASSVGKTLDCPLNVTPSKEDILTTTIPFFAWDKVKDSTGYYVQVFDQDLNPIWQRILSSDTTSVLYDDDNTASGPLQAGHLYRWSVGAIDDEGNESRICPINFIIKTSQGNSPPIVTGGPQIRTIHQLSDGAESYISLAIVQVNDPDGLSDIASVTVTDPEGSFLELYDDGNNCDNKPADGRYYVCIGNMPSPWPLLSGIYYTFTIKDRAGYIVESTCQSADLIDYPLKTRPEDREILDAVNPIFSWDEVKGITWYYIQVEDQDHNVIWQRLLPHTKTSVIYNDDGSAPGPLQKGSFYRWLVKATDDKGNAGQVCRSFYISKGLNNFYLDADGDGYGTSNSSRAAYYPPIGYVESAGDCDDSLLYINPGVSEICDNKDNNCNGAIDEGLDNDADGYLLCAGDCDDNDPNINPGIPEVCNGLDDDCDFIIDERDAAGCTIYYTDEDGDTYGADENILCLCNPKGIYSATRGGDPDDQDPLVVPEDIVSVDLDLGAGWSMISLPVMPDCLILSKLFPGALVVYSYERNVGYKRVQKGEELQVGKGYWILLEEATRYTLTGQAILEYTFYVEDGWYMIGGCTYEAQPFTDNCDIGVIYGYVQGKGYQRILETESLMPGMGYWALFKEVIDLCELTVKAIWTCENEIPIERLRNQPDWVIPPQTFSKGMPGMALVGISMSATNAEISQLVVKARKLEGCSVSNSTIALGKTSTNTNPDYEIPQRQVTIPSPPYYDSYVITGIAASANDPNDSILPNIALEYSELPPGCTFGPTIYRSFPQGEWDEQEVKKDVEGNYYVTGVGGSIIGGGELTHIGLQVRQILRPNSIGGECYCPGYYKKYYISDSEGSDASDKDGSIDEPFKTLKRARDAIIRDEIVINSQNGEPLPYVNGVEIEEHNGYCVLLKGGETFRPPADSDHAKGTGCTHCFETYWAYMKDTVDNGRWWDSLPTCTSDTDCSEGVGCVTDCSTSEPYQDGCRDGFVTTDDCGSNITRCVPEDHRKCYDPSDNAFDAWSQRFAFVWNIRKPLVFSTYGSDQYAEIKSGYCYSGANENYCTGDKKGPLSGIALDRVGDDPDNRILIQNIYFSWFPLNAIFSFDSNNVTIRNNFFRKIGTFHAPYESATEPGGNPIYAAGVVYPKYSHNWVVESNIFKDIHNRWETMDALHVFYYINSGSSTGSIDSKIEDNIVIGASGPPLTFRGSGANNIGVYNNQFLYTGLSTHIITDEVRKARDMPYFTGCGGDYQMKKHYCDEYGEYHNGKAQYGWIRYASTASEVRAGQLGTCAQKVEVSGNYFYHPFCWSEEMDVGNETNGIFLENCKNSKVNAARWSSANKLCPDAYVVNGRENWEIYVVDDENTEDLYSNEECKIGIIYEVNSIPTSKCLTCEDDNPECLKDYCECLDSSCPASFEYGVKCYAGRIWDPEYVNWNRDTNHEIWKWIKPLRPY